MVDRLENFGAFGNAMKTIALDTLKLAQQFQAAGLPSNQAQEMASALGETVGDAIVYFDLRFGESQKEMEIRLGTVRKELHTGLGALRDELHTRLGAIREELDLRLGGIQQELDLRLGQIHAAMATKAEVAHAKNNILKWMFGAVVVILAGVAALLQTLH